MPRTHWLRVTAALAAVALSTGARPSQTPGTIRGRVDTGTLRTMSRPLVGEVSVAPGRSHDAMSHRPSVVYLESGPRGAFSDLPAGRARLDQRREQFVPHVLAITVGTTVDFPNNDLTFHNVFSLSPVKTFDLGRYPVGQTRSVRFDKAGIVPVFCDIHSHMSAYILIFTHPFFALTDEEGRYAITGVPPGTYDIAVWSEAGRADPQRIAVVDGGSIEASFRVGRPRD